MKQTKGPSQFQNPFTEICPVCNGDKKHPEHRDKPCPTCHGEGKVQSKGAAAGDTKVGVDD